MIGLLARQVKEGPGRRARAAGRFRGEIMDLPSPG